MAKFCKAMNESYITSAEFPLTTYFLDFNYIFLAKKYQKTHQIEEVWKWNTTTEKNSTQCVFSGNKLILISQGFKKKSFASCLPDHMHRIIYVWKEAAWMKKKM